jgi:hypothetical protein
MYVCTVIDIGIVLLYVLRTYRTVGTLGCCEQIYSRETEGASGTRENGEKTIKKKKKIIIMRGKKKFEK